MPAFTSRISSSVAEASSPALRLDDAFHETGRVAHDAPVPGWVLEHGRDHRGGRPGRGVGPHELLDRGRTDEGHVAAQDDQRAVRVDRRAQLGERGPDGAPGAIRMLLHDQLDAVREQRLEDPLRGVDHDDPPRARVQSRPHGPQAHRSAAQLVQDLGRIGMHARTLSGGQDEDCRAFVHRSHSQVGDRNDHGAQSWGAGIRTPILRTKT